MSSERQKILEKEASEHPTHAESDPWVDDVFEEGGVRIPVAGGPLVELVALFEEVVVDKRQDFIIAGVEIVVLCGKL